MTERFNYSDRSGSNENDEITPEELHQELLETERFRHEMLTSIFAKIKTIRESLDDADRQELYDHFNYFAIVAALAYTQKQWSNLPYIKMDLKGVSLQNDIFSRMNEEIMRETGAVYDVEAEVRSIFEAKNVNTNNITKAIKAVADNIFNSYRDQIANIDERRNARSLQKQKAKRSGPVRAGRQSNAIGVRGAPRQLRVSDVREIGEKRFYEILAQKKASDEAKNKGQ